MERDRKIRVTIVAAVVVAANLAGAQNARAQTPPTVDTTVPIVGMIYNACKNEMVEYSGTLRMLVQMSESANGSMTLKTQQKIQGSGIGAFTMHEYRVFQINDSQSTGPKPAAGMQYEQTDVNNNDVNGPVQDDHFIMQFKTHMVVQPGGIPGVSFIDFKSCCPGSDGSLSCQPLMF
jgi:hypothetical protein